MWVENAVGGSYLKVVCSDGEEEQQSWKPVVAIAFHTARVSRTFVEATTIPQTLIFPRE